MRVAAVSRIETSVDRAAAAFFAGACGYAAYMWFGGRAGLPLLAWELATVVGAYLLTLRALYGVEREARKVPLSVFDLRDFAPMTQEDELLLHEEFESGHRSLCELQADGMTGLKFEPDELLLEEQFQAEETPADLHPLDEFQQAEQLMIEHFKPARAAEEEPLLLDDILAQLGPDSRVVRLFDPDAMPTPGQLKTRIDRHLEPGGHAIPDAGQALHDALDELRRSIR